MYFPIENLFLSIVQLKTQRPRNVRDCFCFFDIFGKSLSHSPQKTHSIRATVSVDDSPVVLLCSSFWEPLSPACFVILCSFFSQSNSRDSMEWVRFTNVEERGGWFLPKDRINTRRVVSTHLVNYASSLVITTKERKALFYVSPE